MQIRSWSLAENATRGQLLGDTLLQLPPDAQKRLEAAADVAGVPDRHHHDIGEGACHGIDGLAASQAVRDHMRAIYTILAEAEAAAHGSRSSRPISTKSAMAPVSATRCLSAWPWRQRARSASWPRLRQTGQGTVECAHGTSFHPGSGDCRHHRHARHLPCANARCPGSA